MTPLRDTFEYGGDDPWPARIKVVGVGGGGGNTINRMIEEGLEAVKFVSVNTDRQALDRSRASYKVQIGKKLTKGLGAGARPEVGAAAFEEDREAIEQLLDGADLVFLTAGMGGGTGTGASPGVARVAREAGALTIAVVTKPFLFEGRKRHHVAEAGLAELLDVVDSLIVVPNERLLSVVSRNTPLLHAFKMADEVLLHATRGISDLVQKSGEVNVDFADVRTVMTNCGRAVMGEATASGEHRGARAAGQAVSSPFLDEVSISGAAGVLINITGGPDMTLDEVGAAMGVIHDAAGDEAEIIFGAVHDPLMQGKVRVTVIAAGLQEKRRTQAQREASSSQSLGIRRKPERGPASPSQPDNDLDIPTFLRRQTG
jgi:cell division protein FtsZ